MSSGITRWSIPMVVATMLMTVGTVAAAGSDNRALDLYMDTETKQIFAEPGPGRVRLGRFRPMTDEDDRARDVADGQSGEATVAAEPGDSALELTDESGEFSMAPGGRLHAQYSYQDDDLTRNGQPVDAASGTEIRRARFNMSGDLGEDFEYLTEFDFAGNDIAITDVFLVYTAFDPLEITVGHQKHAISMELQESSNDIMFTERSLLNAMTDTLFDRAIGINAKGSGRDWSAQIGLYGDSAAPNDRDQEADEGYGLGSRLTYALVNDTGRVLHLGAYAGLREPADSGRVNNESPAFNIDTTNHSNVALTDTGPIDAIDRATIAGLELAAVAGPWSLQGEYARVGVSRENGLPSLDFIGYYLQMGWVLTGESRRYKGSDGEFKRLQPRHAFSPDDGYWGAWEVALRFDQHDLTDRDVIGGEQSRASLALNWYMNDYVRVMLDYNRILDVEDSPQRDTGGGQPDGLNIYTLRTQFAF
ncbi:OprO/OprP family phosphate-selective porin [Spectribacter hydrogenooxidans]|uniref:Porin n=1 Tax=Spectribacter hydrogenoxidans TaxID=3075608 RepID=A0ABU3C1Y1_9GAMM|nr:porin [Salinisphaera sp. W335]MDT0635525.1 porin [Salinisphaera sp. W335]